MRDVIARIVKAIGRNTNISVVTTFADLPETIKQSAAQAGVLPKEFRGVINGKHVIFLTQDTHSSIDEIQQTIFDELYGHYGMRSLFGREMYEKLNSLYFKVGRNNLLALAKKHNVDIDSYRIIILTQAHYASEKIQNNSGCEITFPHAILMDELIAHIAQHEKR